MLLHLEKYAIEGVLILAGFRVTKIPPLYGQFVIVAVIWVPALAAVLTIKWHPFLGIICMMAMTTALSVYINELTLRNRSSILAGWIHGAFNGQVYGVWRILFPKVNPMLGGFTGLLGMASWVARCK